MFSDIRTSCVSKILLSVSNGDFLPFFFSGFVAVRKLCCAASLPRFGLLPADILSARNFSSFSFAQRAEPCSTPFRCRRFREVYFISAYMPRAKATMSVILKLYDEKSVKCVPTVSVEVSTVSNCIISTLKSRTPSSSTDKSIAAPRPAETYRTAKTIIAYSKIVSISGFFFFNVSTPCFR